MRVVGADPDGAAFVAGNVPASAQQRQDPARPSILATADVHAEPDDVFEARAMALLPVDLPRFRRILHQFLIAAGRAAHVPQHKILGAMN